MLADVRANAREQLAAAWQIHSERIADMLATGWQEQIGRVFDERFSELAGQVADEFRRSVTDRVSTQVETANSKARDAARRELADTLNQSVRRMRQAEDSTQWVDSLLDGARAFAPAAVLLRIQGETAVAEGARPALAAPLPEIPLSAAPALAATVESHDTVICSRAAGELSPALAALPSNAQRAGLFPIAVRGETMAVLYAEPAAAGLDTASLELLTTCAAAILETRRSPGAAPPKGLIAIAAAARQEGAVNTWASMPRPVQDEHLKAQRFARVRVAEMQLYQSAAVREGRAAGNLYSLLREEIDAARVAYREQFLDGPAARGQESMVDYFHAELVKTLGQDELAALGTDYPGPLV